MNADAERHEARGQAHGNRDLPAEHDAHQKIAAVRVGAEGEID